MAMIAAEAAASTALKFLAPFAGFIAACAVGFVGAEVFEHRGPGPTISVPFVGWKVHPFGESLEAKLDDLQASIPPQLAAAKAAGIAQQATSDKIAFGQWDVSLKACRADATDARNTAARAIAATDKFTSTQADQAYRLGRATCEAPNATPSPAGGPGAQPSGVPDPGADFANLFGAGAYTAPAETPVPAGGPGPADVRTPPT